jgi:hypothetical protein
MMHRLSSRYRKPARSACFSGIRTRSARRRGVRDSDHGDKRGDDADHGANYIEQVMMDNHRVFKMSFAGVYPHYIAKAEKKGRTKQEVDDVICWLTGYTRKALEKQIKDKKDLESFFREAPALHPNAGKITGTICGVTIQEIEHPLMRKIRYMDKLVDELAKGRPMDKILRA